MGRKVKVYYGYPELDIYVDNELKFSLVLCADDEIIIELKPQKEQEEKLHRTLTVEDLEVGEYYTAFYTDKNGDTKERCFLVEEIPLFENYIVVTLVRPEKNAGEYRSFSVEDLDCIQANRPKPPKDNPSYW
jgi:hypothetical protein